MARYNFRRLPGALGAISIPHLLALLEPHRAFFAAKGLSLENRREPFDYEGLLAILVDDRSGTPPGLLEAIQMIGEMASPEAMDVLLESTGARGIEITGYPEPTPADVAAQVFVSAPDIFAKEYANSGRAPSRRYLYFQARVGADPEPALPPADFPGRLAKALDVAFSSRLRGCGVRVSGYQSGQRIEYLVRRGGCSRRMPVMQNGRATSVVVRPERYDIVLYDPVSREIAISADGDAEVDVYREVLGRELLGSEKAFRDFGRFDLSPLRTDGRKALACGDVDGIRGVALTELSWREQGERSTRTQKGEDLFRETRGFGRSLREGTILGATFSIKFGGRAIARNVRIRPTNIAEFPCSTDTAVFDEWLTRRGFMRPRIRHATGTAAGLASC